MRYGSTQPAMVVKAEKGRAASSGNAALTATFLKLELIS